MRRREGDIEQSKLYIQCGERSLYRDRFLPRKWQGEEIADEIKYKKSVSASRNALVGAAISRPKKLNRRLPENQAKSS